MDIFKLKNDSIEYRLIYWLYYGEVGASSSTIAKYMYFGDTENAHIPHDVSDFMRCYKLLQIFPEWKVRLPEIGEHIPIWKELVKHWDLLSTIYEKSVEDKALEYVLFNYIERITK